MNEAATGRWQVAMRADDLWEGEMEGVEVSGEKVLLVNVDGQVRAYRNRCPHQAWALSEGELDGETITCARHLWQFDALTGAGVNPDNTQLVSYPCRLTEDGAVAVDLG
jgi:toluene monooxygenase system ferredoxin subunit